MKKIIVECWDCGIELNYNISLAAHDRAFMSDAMSRKNEPRYSYDKMPEVPWKRIRCEKCGKVHAQTAKDEKEQYKALKTKIMFEQAVEALERQKKPLDIYRYKEAIEAVREYATEKPDKFDSSSEMIAAIFLISERIDVKIQKKILEYRVDFSLESLRIVLEIDGDMHKLREDYDSVRDKRIREALGDEWEVIRVPAAFLHDNAEKLIDAIVALRDKKRATRAKGNGFLPSNYSRTSKAISRQVERIATVED